MQLKNNLYTIVHKEVEGQTNSYTIELNPSCIIYQAHFPGEPITPGVCIVQMGKELLEDLLAASLEIVKVKNVKFLSVISPKETTTIVYQMKKVERSEDGKEVKAQLVATSEEEPKAKISLVLRVTC